MRTHWIPPFTIRRADRTQQAFCGVFIEETQYSTEPTCADCRRLLTEEDRELDALRRTAWDPADRVASVDFDPLAGYRPRGTR